MPVSPAGHRQVQIALVPALVDGLELLDRRVVVAVLQIADLNLVDAFEFVGVQAEFATDLARRSARPARATECATIADAVRPVAGEGAGLFAAEVGQLRPGGRVSSRRSTLPCDWPCRTSTSRAAHGLPSRSCVNQRDASSSCGGAAPAADPVGHEPRYRTSAQRRCSALSASATASSSMCPTQSRKKM